MMKKMRISPLGDPKIQNQKKNARAHKKQKRYFDVTCGINNLSIDLMH